MKNLKKKLCAVLSVAACVCVGVAIDAEFDKEVTASAEDFTATSIQMLNGASVRKDEERHGIRFATFIGNQVDLTNVEEFGTLFIPETVLDGVEELTIDACFDGVFPAVAKWDMDESKLTEKDGYDDGKFFNAVLDLSNVSADAAIYLNSKIVARSYMKKNGVYCYDFGSVSRAPAYVAALALDGGEEHSTLENYVSEVKLETDGGYNAVAGEFLETGLTTNVEGIPVKYELYNGGMGASGISVGTDTSVKLAEIREDKVFALQEGKAKFYATAAGGRVKANDGEPVVFQITDYQTMYFNENYLPKAEGREDFTIAACDLKEVRLEGVTLTEGIDYTYESDIVTLAKARAFGDYTTDTKANETRRVTLVANNGQECDVPIKAFYISKGKSFGEGSTSFAATDSYGIDVFVGANVTCLDRGTARVERIDCKNDDGELEVAADEAFVVDIIPTDGAQKFSRLTLDQEYLNAVFAHSAISEIKIVYGLLGEFDSALFGCYGTNITLRGSGCCASFSYKRTNWEMDKARGKNINFTYSYQPDAEVASIVIFSLQICK